MFKRVEIYFWWQIGLMIDIGKAYRGYYISLEIPFVTIIFRIGKIK